MYNNYIRTIDFGYVPVRKNFTNGIHVADVELVDGFAEIRTDLKTNQPFAVLYDDNWNLIK